MKKTENYGISLVVLVITIVVALILTSAVVLSLSNNNVITQASKLAFMTDLKSFADELNTYSSGQLMNKPRGYSSSDLQADTTSVKYGETEDTSKTIYDIIPSLENTSKYSDALKVVNGKLVFTGTDTAEQEWAKELGIGVLVAGEPQITLTAVSETTVKSGTDIVYKIEFSSDSAISTVDLLDKLEILDNSGTALSIQPNYTIGSVSGTSSDNTRSVDVTIGTGTLSNGTYKLRIKAGAVINENNVSNTEYTDSSTNFNIQTVIQVNPIILTADSTEWTNGNVTVSITYPTEAVTKQYSTDGTTWDNYTSQVVVTNNTTVYAKGLDAQSKVLSNESLVVSNIDKTLPTVTVTNGGTTSSSITVTAVANDAGVSGLNAGSYQYSDDDGLTWTSATTDTSYTFNTLTTGTYQCRVKVSDNAMNNATSDAVAISTQSLGTITLLANPTSWTNGNVTVTISYPSETVTKQYSTNGTTWDDYTTSIVINTNSTTVYAKGLDVGGNQTAQATLTVANIDYILPTAVYATNGGSGSTASTTVTFSDLGGSLINDSTLQYVWDTQNSITPSSGWTTFTNGANITKNEAGTYYLWVKGNDNAGNTLVTKSNSFTITILTYAIANTPVIEPASVTNTLNVNSTINGQLPSYNNPVIPAGFGAVNTTDASWDNIGVDWNKGLVIQDTSGNQFVWVPVDGTNIQYSKWCTTGTAYNDASISDDTLPFNEYSTTSTYKGFYIARYESAFDYNGGSIRVAIKKSTGVDSKSWSNKRNSAHSGYLWNFIVYTDAKTYSENMATSYGYDTSKIGTNLVTGTQWDTAMKWIQNSGKSVTNSNTWGNHMDSISPANISGFGSLQISGYSDYWKANNIYDLSGNIWEWTNEKISTNFIMRGSSYNYNGSAGNYPAAYRLNVVGTQNYGYNGFRTALYIL